MLPRPRAGRYQAASGAGVNRIRPPGSAAQPPASVGKISLSLPLLPAS